MQFVIIILELILFLQLNFDIVLAQIDDNPDIKRNTSEFILSRGYPCEIHTITTEDGYILTYQRIPHGKYNNDANATRPVVFLQHGLLASSRSWFLQPDGKILPFLLAEEGYDVWVGNARGTSYSLGHVNYTYKQKEYWRFSWQEMGTYDLPAAIDYILDKTGNVKLFYIGHSMGTTMFFVMCARRPEYNEKIILMSAYAPIGYLANATSPLVVLGLLAPAVTATTTEDGDIVTELGVGQLLPELLTETIHKLVPLLCTLTFHCCNELLYATMGYDPDQTNNTIGTVAEASFPDYTSTRTLIHYGQEMHSGKFACYDYGPYNEKEYENETTTTLPPNINITKITAPIAFYSGLNDLLGTPKDIAKMSTELPNLIKYCAVGFDCWNHLDFVTGINASELLYKPTIELMNSYKNNPGQTLPNINIENPKYGCEGSNKICPDSCSKQCFSPLSCLLPPPLPPLPSLPLPPLLPSLLPPLRLL